MGSLGLAVGLFTSSAALAIPITGQILFTGEANLVNNVGPGSPGGATSANADFIDFANPVDVSQNASTGSYSGFNGSTDATFTDFSFGDVGTVGPKVVTPLWTVVFGGVTYSFNLTSITLNTLVGSQRNIEGNGIATISGGIYDASPGHWTLSTSGDGVTAITFSSASTAVPEGGSSLALLGVGLLTVGLVRRKLKA